MSRRNTVFPTWLGICAPFPRHFHGCTHAGKILVFFTFTARPYWGNPSTLHLWEEDLVQLRGSVGLQVPVLVHDLEDEQGEEELLDHLKNITADCRRLLDFSQTSSSF